MTGSLPRHLGRGQRWVMGAAPDRRVAGTAARTGRSDPGATLIVSRVHEEEAMPETEKTLPSGPLLLPLPHHLGERLKVHKTSEKWLLAGLSDELDALRAEHIERRTRLAEARQEQIDLGAKFARED